MKYNIYLVTRQFYNNLFNNKLRYIKHKLEKTHSRLNHLKDCIPLWVYTCSTYMLQIHRLLLFIRVSRTKLIFTGNNGGSTLRRIDYSFAFFFFFYFSYCLRQFIDDISPGPIIQLSAHAVLASLLKKVSCWLASYANRPTAQSDCIVENIIDEERLRSHFPWIIVSHDDRLQFDRS